VGKQGNRKEPEMIHFTWSEFEPSSFWLGVVVGEVGLLALAVVAFKLSQKKGA
jgi:hypothetical protein